MKRQLYAACYQLVASKRGLCNDLLSILSYLTNYDVNDGLQGCQIICARKEMMHPGHLALILKLLNVGMVLICGILISRILKAAIVEFSLLQ